MRVAVVHPDLGLGGAERLILDAILELQAAGHEVQVYTAHHDPKRCFRETLAPGAAPARAIAQPPAHSSSTDGTRAPWLHVHGGWLPRTVFGRLHALCAFVRCLLLALVLLCSRGRFQVVLLDQVSAPIALLRACSRTKARLCAQLCAQRVSSHASALAGTLLLPLP